MEPCSSGHLYLFCFLLGCIIWGKIRVSQQILDSISWGQHHWASSQSLLCLFSNKESENSSVCCSLSSATSSHCIVDLLVHLSDSFRPVISWYNWAPWDIRHDYLQLRYSWLHHGFHSSGFNYFQNKIPHNILVHVLVHQGWFSSYCHLHPFLLLCVSHCVGTYFNDQHYFLGAYLKWSYGACSLHQTQVFQA